MMRISATDKQNYGFEDAGPAERTYAVTADYSDIARNHCAATMLTNAMLYLDPSDGHAQTMAERFQEIHDVVGDGPVLWLQGKADRYFHEKGLPLVCRQIWRHPAEQRTDRMTALVRTEIAAGRPCAMLVAASLLRWHWVLAVPACAGEYDMAGARAAGDQVCAVGRTDAVGAECPLRIVDGWHAGRIFHYIPDRGSRLLAVAVFHRTDAAPAS